jgi:hypothetical protein
MYRLNLTKELKEKEKKKMRSKGFGGTRYKNKKQKVLKAGTPPQLQRYRYVKESRSLWGGDYFGEFDKRIFKRVKAKDKWNKKRGNIITGEYIVEDIAKKWVPKMKMWLYEDQLLCGSSIGVKDSQAAVTRECAKIHVLKFCSVTRKLEWIRDCGIRYRSAANVENKERRIVIQRLKQNTVKIAKVLFRHSNVKRLIIGYKKVIYENKRKFGGNKKEYLVRMISDISVLTVYRVLKSIRNSIKWHIYWIIYVKECNYLSEKKGYQCPKRKRRVRVSGKTRLPHEGKKGENARGLLWGILLYTND